MSNKTKEIAAKENKNHKNFQMAVYGLAFIITTTLFIIQITNSKRYSSPDYIMNITTSTNNSKAGLALFGPVKLRKTGEMAYVKMKTSLPQPIATLSIYSTSAEKSVNGEVNLIEAKKFQGSDGSLKTKDEIKKIIADADKGKEKEILEVYSFPFSFWTASGVDEGYSWSESDKKKELSFKIGEKGSYYFLIEYYADAKTINGAGFSFTVIEGKRPILWYALASLLSLGFLVFTISPKLSNWLKGNSLFGFIAVGGIVGAILLIIYVDWNISLVIVFIIGYFIYQAFIKEGDD